VAHRCADTIVASITTTDDDDVFVFGIDVAAVFEFGVQESFGV
jgi:hypothetical protein